LREASELFKYNEKPTTLTTNEVKKETESSKPMGGGRPGTSPNATALNQSANLEQFATQSSKQKESNVTENKVAGHEVTVTDKAGLVPRTASIVVSIPQSHYKKAFFRQWLEQNPDKTEADLASIDKTLLVQGVTNVKGEVEKNIQRALATLLPPEPPGGDRFPRVSVGDYPDSPLMEPPEPTFAKILLAAAMENWQVLGLFVLAGVALLFIRSISRSTPGGSTDAGFDNGFSLQLEDPATWDLSALGESSEEVATQSAGGNSEESGQARKFNTTGGEIKEELTSLVRDNPDAAASLLRTWIGEAS
jgi:flagellar M-ring protein FliF